jgi:hypothetical protein
MHVIPSDRLTEVIFELGATPAAYYAVQRDPCARVGATRRRVSHDSD